MANATVNKLIADYHKQSEARGKELLRQHAEWRDRQHLFPSTQAGSRGATSPLGGVARPAEEGVKAPKVQAPKSGEGWW
jgi:hypothetical protein